MTDRNIRIAINGAAGRMGQMLIALAGQSQDLQVVSALEAPGHPAMGRPAGPVVIAESLAGGVDVVIDFSLPVGTMAVLPQARRAGAAMVIGTTGLSPDQQARIDEACGHIPIVQAPNMSVGVNVLLRLVAQAARALGEAYDIEIVEAHHRFKKDAPSGTALALARSICEATGKDLDASMVHGRSGEQPRRPGEIGMHAVRMGDVVGQHSVCFGTLGETISLGHAAHTRETFAGGALRAARWVAGRAPGKYGMNDVLFGG